VATSRNGKGGRSNNVQRGLVQWPKINLPLVRLHLDRDNPRHEPVASEDEAIAKLYEKEKVEAIAKDIVTHGAMSPFDVIGVVAMLDNPGHFIAVEGNRRLCALILLNDPDRAPTVASKALFRELSSRIKLPATIEVVQLGSKEDSKRWVDLRHLGPQEGQGLVSWNATQKDRAAGGGANALAVALLDRARDGQWLGDEKPPAVTTLTRYLSNPLVRHALGLGDPRQLIFTHDQDEVDAALRQFLLDAMPTPDGSTPRVHSRTNNIERGTYAHEFKNRGFSPQTVLSAPSAPSPARPAPKAKKPRNPPDPGKRPYLIPQGFVCNAKDKNLLMLFREMQRTHIDDHEFACAFLLRAFIERIMTLYMQKTDKNFVAPQRLPPFSRCRAKTASRKEEKIPRWPPQTAPLMAGQTAPGRTVGLCLFGGGGDA